MAVAASFPFPFLGVGGTEIKHYLVDLLTFSCFNKLNQFQLHLIFLTWCIITNNIFHVCWVPFVQFISSVGLPSFSWRCWFFAFVRELLFRHISVCKEWFSLKCNKQVQIVFSESRYQRTWFSILIQFVQHTKAPVASNSSAVKHVTHFK